MGAYEPQVGDRVRVTVEGVVKKTMGDYGALVYNDNEQWLAEFYYERDGASLEKIEPPVEVFKPGDVVRDKANPNWMYVLTKGGGYTELDSGHHYPDGADEFTSECYERVNLS